jgi:hypothetical protein
MKVTVFWNVMAVSLIASDQHFNLQDRRYYTPSHTSEKKQKLSITTMTALYYSAIVDNMFLCSEIFILLVTG